LRHEAPLNVPTGAGRTSALLALHVAVALFGFAALFGKWIALSPVAIVLGRTVIAAATLALVASMRRQPFGRPERALLLNGPLLALHWVSFFAAVQLASVAIALLGYASFPVFVLLLERGTRASRTEYATALLAALGLAMLAAHLSWSSAGTRGLAVALVSGVTFALLVVRNRRLVAERSAARIAMWQNLAAGVCLLPIVAIADPLAAWPRFADAALLLVLGIVCTGLAHTLFIASMRRVSAHSASVVASLEPVYGIALAAWLLGEKPDGLTMAGGVLIVVAALIASRRTE
jgi:drug/metabolite transporter (DMT)-like permease